MSDFRTIARAIAATELLDNVYDVLTMADAVMAALPKPAPVTKMHFTPDALVSLALGNDNVIEYMRSRQKIMAIKELRTVSGCGLKEAKDAIEDYRVMSFYPPEPTAAPVDPYEYN